MSTASSPSMVSTNWLDPWCLNFTKIPEKLAQNCTIFDSVTQLCCNELLIWFILQVQTLIRILFSLNLSPPPPRMPVTQPWSWTLSPPCEEKCSSSRTGIIDILYMLRYLSAEVNLECFSSDKSWLLNSFLFLCVLSFLWRSYPQSNTPQQSLITNFWTNAPVNIDAAYESQQSDSVLLFKGTVFCSLYLPKAPNLTLFSRLHYLPLHACTKKYFL